MKFALVVLAAPESSLCHFRAQQFARALPNANVTLTRVFFYGEGVRGAATENDEALKNWKEIATSQGCDLVLCSASAEHYGLLSPPAPFALMGLGALMEAGHDCERVISFD